MSRSKKRRLQREGGLKRTKLSEYQEAVRALAKAAKSSYLGLVLDGADWTGNKQNDLLETWSFIWPGVG